MKDKIKKKSETYKEYSKKYDRRVKRSFLFAFLLVVLTCGFAWCLMEDLRPVAFLLGQGLLLILLMAYVQRQGDYFVSNVVEDLSKALDHLLELNQEAVFTDYEDSLVSKLQTQLEKMIHILKQQNEQERLEHESIKALVSDLSHQLKTPLSNLNMYTEFLKQDDLTMEQRKDYVSVLELSLKRLTFLSESMIKLSRLESGLVQLHLEEKSINETILIAIKNTFVKAQEKKIEIKYQEEFKGVLLHDQNWTAEAIYNLIDNAIKYGEEENVITIKIRELSNMVEISVEDCNKPIVVNDYNRIFQRFVRGENKGSTEGMGIGLYLTREIMEKQKGLVVVKKGEIGNCFVMMLRK